MDYTYLQYQYALERIEDLLALVGEDTPADDKNAIELSIVSDVVMAYEQKHFPIEKPSVSQIIADSLEEKGMSQKDLAVQIGLSASRVSDYISGRAEPTLKIARRICQVLSIRPSVMLGI